MTRIATFDKESHCLQTARHVLLDGLELILVHIKESDLEENQRRFIFTLIQRTYKVIAGSNIAIENRFGQATLNSFLGPNLPNSFPIPFRWFPRWRRGEFPRTYIMV